MNPARLYCENCGTPLLAGRQNCEKCGAPVPGAQAVRQGQPLEWQAKLFIFQNAVVVKQLALVLGISLAFLFLLSLVLDWPPDLDRVLQSSKIVLIVAAILGGLLLIAGLFYSGGYEFQYHLDDQGIQARPTGGTAIKNTIVNLLLIFSGRPGPAGAGLIAMSRQEEYVAWKDVSRVAAQPNQKTLTLYKGRRPVMVVACDAAHFERVLRLAQEASEHLHASG
jgi:hypothetical protein